MRFLRESSTHPLYAVVLAPIERLQYSSGGEKLGALLAAVGTFLLTDAFTAIIILMVASGTADTIYGRAIAKKLDRYDQVKADIGLHSKIMGVVLTLLIRGFEGWWSRIIIDGPFDGWHTSGLLSMAVALTLFVNDLKSIQEKRVRFGQPPLPVLGRVLDLLDRFAAALGAGPGGELVERREGDERRVSDPKGVLDRRDEEPPDG